MPATGEQEDRMRWVLFWVLISFFIVIVLGTLGALFLDFGNLTEKERDLLFYAFLLEIGGAVFTLFYSLFGIKRKDEAKERKVRLSLGEFEDVTNLIGKTALLNPSEFNGNSLGEIQTKVQNDQGPYLPLELPPTAHSVYITVPTGEKAYSGSFVVGTYLVDMFEEQN